MDDFGILARDFGFRPQGKSAPMSASKGGGTSSSGGGSSSVSSTMKSRWNSASVIGDDDGIFGPPSHNPSSSSPSDYLDVFGGPPVHAQTLPKRPPPPPPVSMSTDSTSPFDSSFQGTMDSPTRAASMPAYDKYDDDIFDGLPGIKNSASVKDYDVFSSISSSARDDVNEFDDLLGNFGRAEPESKGSSRDKRSRGTEREVTGLDELIPGFGGSSPPADRVASENNRSHQPYKSDSKVLEDPFVVLENPTYSSSGLFTDTLDPNNSSTSHSQAERSSVSGGFDDNNVFTKSMPFLDKDRKSKSSSSSVRNSSPHTLSENGPTEKAKMSNFENSSYAKAFSDDYQETPPLFDFPTGLSSSHKTTNGSGLKPKDVHAYEPSSHEMSPKSDGKLESSDDVWLTVSEIPLFTQLTNSPPPSRPPPPKPISVSKDDKGSLSGSNVKRNVGSTNPSKTHVVSSVDELEDFAMAKPRAYAEEHAETLSTEEETEVNSAAAVKEAVDRAEAKFKHAKEVRERERDAKVFRSREFMQQEDEKARRDAQEREYREKQERLDREREQKEREEKEQKRLEKEREREREIEREKGRQAVERATREARERAAVEARLKAERAAVEKANAEARERAERAAVQRAAAEARERAAAEARERAEKVAAEARQRAAQEKQSAEAREKAAVEKAAAEVRLRAERAAVERAAAEARERAAAAAREKQQKSENDLEAFFSMGARPTSAPRQRSSTSEFTVDALFQSRGGSDGIRRTSVSTSSSMRKASSSANIVDDLASMFGAAASTEEFQDVEGESEERRRARLERHQRTLERTKKALAEKNERDMQTQREQAERHRIAETLDIEIKRWAVGKEGNLRALLSTLQYVLWPECGWQPVSLTDLITAASVKKVYRKATLCIHPDKVQQKGANLQQKYIAEKVFDLLKEAWNKFNSEELF